MYNTFHRLRENTAETKQMTYTLYFADGNTYTADFEDENAAANKGLELAKQTDTEFDYAEAMQGCRLSVLRRELGLSWHQFP